jgi:hypothetical protein
VVQRSGGRSVCRSAVDAFASERSTFSRTIVQTQVDTVFQTFHPRAFHFGKQVIVRTEAFGLAQPTVFQYKLHPNKKAGKQLVPFEIEKMKAEGKSDADIPTIRVSKKKYISINDRFESETVQKK